MVRQFYLENELGQTYSLMNMEKNCFFNSPAGLGYSYDTRYEQIGNNFIQDVRKINQSEIMGELLFKNYDNYKECTSFIENAQKLKLAYKVPFESGVVTYYKDIDLNSLDKAEKGNNGLLTCGVSFYAKSLWYEQNEIIYTISTTGQKEVRWDFSFDSYFISYSNREIIFTNKGQTEAPFKLEVNGYVIAPQLEIQKDDKELYKIKFEDETIENGEKLVYCTKDTELSVYKQDTNGNKINLFENLDLNNTNFFKLPLGTSKIILSADDDITSAKLTIYVEYKTV